MTWFTGEDC